MTRMAGANPKIAAIFGGDGFGLKNDAINNAALQDRSALQMAATNADASAAIGESEAEAMIKAAKLGASATRAQGAAAGQSAMFGGLSSGISSLAGGFANMGGGGIGNITSDTGSFTTGNPANVVSNPMADIQRSLGPGVKFGMY